VTTLVRSAGGTPRIEGTVRLPYPSADAPIGRTIPAPSLIHVTTALFVAFMSITQTTVVRAESRLPGVAQQAARTGPARVVVTIVVEGLRIPAVDVELRNVGSNVVIAKTTSDAVGQVTFPDVSAGRYVVRAVREGFADAESSPFNVSPGETEQVLV
jgi:hypothetical protein